MMQKVFYLFNILTYEFEESEIQATVDAYREPQEQCEYIQQQCVGDYAQFNTISDCVEFFESIPKTKPECPLLKGNTRGCRGTHSILIDSNLRPEVHCFHVGPLLADPNGHIKCSDVDCDGIGVEDLFLCKQILPYMSRYFNYKDLFRLRL
eukprot:UN33886